AGRQHEHAQEGRHRPRPVDLAQDRRAARRLDHRRIGDRQGLDLQGHHPDQRHNGQGSSPMSKKILVVEDTEDNRQILRDLLGMAGYDMIEANDGAEGVAQATAHKPDLILMDIQMPVMDGYEGTRRIKANPELKPIPIVAVTSYALSGDEEKARAAGCDAYIAKP